MIDHNHKALCLGMYDFQIVEDVNIVLNAFDQAMVRQRPFIGSPDRGTACLNR